MLQWQLVLMFFYVFYFSRLWQKETRPTKHLLQPPQYEASWTLSPSTVRGPLFTTWTLRFSWTVAESTPSDGQIQTPKVQMFCFGLFFRTGGWYLSAVRLHHRPTPRIKEPLSSFTSAVTPSSRLPPRQVSINLARGWYSQGLPHHPRTPLLIPLIHPSLLASAWENESAVHPEYS